VFAPLGKISAGAHECNYGRSRNLEFTIVDLCLAHTKSHCQINSLALTVAMWRHWSREPIKTLIRTIDIYV